MISKITRSILLVILAFSLTLQFFVPFVYADEMKDLDNKKIITDFDPLDESIENQTVKVGTKIEKLKEIIKFPEKISAVIKPVKVLVKDTLVNKNSENSETLPVDFSTDEVNNEEHIDEKLNSIPNDVAQEKVDVSVSWEIQDGKVFSVDKPNTYVYTAKISDSQYNIDDDVQLPEILIDVVSEPTDVVSFPSNFMRSKPIDMTGYKEIYISPEDYKATNFYNYESSFSVSKFLPENLKNTDSLHYVSTANDKITEAIPYIHLSECLKKAGADMTLPVTRIVYDAGFPKLASSALVDGILSPKDYPSEDINLYNIAHEINEVEVIGFARLDDNNLPANTGFT